MTNQQLKISATYIKKLASFPDAEDRISLYLDSLLAPQPQKDAFNEPENSKSKAVSSLLHFTYKEIKNMATTFKKVFIANGLCAHVLKKPSGKNSYCYEIRYRSNGYDIRAYSTDLTKAKELFIAKTTAQENPSFSLASHAFIDCFLFSSAIIFAPYVIDFFSKQGITRFCFLNDGFAYACYLATYLHPCVCARRRQGIDYLYIFG